MLAALPSLNGLMFQATDAYGRTLGIDPKTGKPIPDPYPPPVVTPTVDAAPSSAAGSPGAISTITKAGVSAISNLSKFSQWAGDIVSRDDQTGDGVSLEDLIFIVLGVLLIAAAVFSFVFTGDQVKGIAKDVVKSAAAPEAAAATAAVAATKAAAPKAAAPKDAGGTITPAELKALNLKNPQGAASVLLRKKG
jgi:hypothetical protein